MADVLQSRSPCPVPVGFHLSPLHPHLMYLPLLLVRPVQYSVAQQGSLFRVGDVQHQQLLVDLRVHYGLFAWLFTGHLRFWRCLFTLGLLTFVRVILVTISVSAPLLSLVPPLLPPLVLGPSPPRAPPVVFFLTAFVPSASSGPSSSVESSSP